MPMKYFKQQQKKTKTIGSPKPLLRIASNFYLKEDMNGQRRHEQVR